MAIHSEKQPPRELLKSINPQEATLFDGATGLHIRFRLGGQSFPPMLFYKIFTHRPISDICAYCPRDYVKDQPRCTPSACLHAKDSAEQMKPFCITGLEAPQRPPAACLNSICRPLASASKLEEAASVSLLQTNCICFKSQPAYCNKQWATESSDGGICIYCVSCCM